MQFNVKERFRFQLQFLEGGSSGSGSAFGFREKRVRAVPVRFLSQTAPILLFLAF